jgi:hypothetical protein
MMSQLSPTTYSGILRTIISIQISIYGNLNPPVIFKKAEKKRGLMKPR